MYLEQRSSSQEVTVKTAYLYWLLGVFGGHYFYLKKYRWAALYACTLGLFGLGWLLDLFLIPQMVEKKNQHRTKVYRYKHVKPPTSALHLSDDEDEDDWHDDADEMDFPAATRSHNSIPGLSSLSSSDRDDGDDDDETGYWELVRLYLPPLGIFGAHHFYTGRRGWGVLYLLTGGLCLFGWVSDFFRLEFFLAQRRRRKEAALGVLTGSRYQIEYDAATQRHDLISTYQLWFSPFGILGCHHFYLGNNKLGCIYLFTLGGCGVLWILDFFRIQRFVAESNQGINNLLKHLPTLNDNFSPDTHPLDEPNLYRRPYEDGMTTSKSAIGRDKHINGSPGSHYYNYGSTRSNRVRQRQHQHQHQHQPDIYSTSNPRSQYLDDDNGDADIINSHSNNTEDGNKKAAGTVCGQSYHQSYNVMYSPTDSSSQNMFNSSLVHPTDTSRAFSISEHKDYDNNNDKSRDNSLHNDSRGGMRKSRTKTQISAQLGYIPGILSWLNGSENPPHDYNGNTGSRDSNTSSSVNDKSNSHRSDNSNHPTLNRRTLMNYGLITDEHVNRTIYTNKENARPNHHHNNHHKHVYSNRYTNNESNSNNFNYNQGTTCMVCGIAKTNTVISDCGHQCFCNRCGDRLMKDTFANCPLCGVLIRDLVLIGNMRNPNNELLELL